MKVECLYDQKPLGYELYFDGRRAGYEPAWDLATATSNCAVMNTAYEPATVVDCLFDGIEIPTATLGEQH